MTSDLFPVTSVLIATAQVLGLVIVVVPDGETPDQIATEEPVTLPPRYY